MDVCEIADPAIILFQNVSTQSNEVRYQLRMGGLTLFLLLLRPCLEMHCFSPVNRLGYNSCKNNLTPIPHQALE